MKPSLLFVVMDRICSCTEKFYKVGKRIYSHTVLEREIGGSNPARASNWRMGRHVPRLAKNTCNVFVKSSILLLVHI